MNRLKKKMFAHCVTPPKLLSTMKAEILSCTSPVLGSLTGVLANTVKISARPPLLQERGAACSLYLVQCCSLVVNVQSWLRMARLRPHLIQILLPLRVKYFPHGDWTATLLMEAASEPLAGSVRQKAATCSPGWTNTNRKSWTNATDMT